MMEKMKTIVLIVLIAVSLMQTYWIVYPANRFDVFDEKQYVSTESIGTIQQIDALVFPAEMIVHWGGDQHTILYPETYRYNLIYNTLKGRTLDGLRISELSELYSESLSEQIPGIEIRFGESIPLRLLQNVIPIQANVLEETIHITAIWLALMGDEQNEARTYLITDTESLIYEAVNTTITDKDIAQFIDFDARSERYSTVHFGGNTLYIPDFDLEIEKMSLQYRLIAPDQLIQNFFDDPSSTRNLQERDGSQIYTDGKRGLQIKMRGQWMNYTDPSAPIERSEEVYDNVIAAMQFVNQRGGWNGKYRMEQVNKLMNGEREVIFRQYYNSYPIHDTEAEGHGMMRMLVQNGKVSVFERSLINAIPINFERERTVMPGGEQLVQALEDYENIEQVVKIGPAYDPEVRAAGLQLLPKWAVYHRDGTWGFLP